MKRNQFKKTNCWIIKQKDSNHMVRRGIYQEKTDAEDDLGNIPSPNYEIVECEIRRKLKTKK